MSTRLWSSTDWEDHLVAERSLDIAPTDDVVTIGGAGCIASCLLLHEPRSVVAIHHDPDTIALCELKVAAIQLCSRSEFVDLLVGHGATAVYERMRAQLPPRLRDHWDAQPDHIALGLLGCGTYERTHRAFRERLERIPGAAAAIRGLFELEHVADQLDYVDNVLSSEGFLDAYRATFSWQAAIASGSLRPNELRYAQDPDAFTNRYLDMMRRTLGRTPARDNFYVEYLLTGRLGDIDESRGPPYLRPAGFARLRGLVDRIRFVVGDAHAVLRATPDAAFDKVHVIGMTSWADAERDALVDELARVIRPGGRWTGKDHRFSARRVHPRMRPLDALADELAQLDRFPRGGKRRIEIAADDQSPAR